MWCSSCKAEFCAFFVVCCVFCCSALKHSPSKRKSVVDRQKSLADGNSTFVSRDMTDVTELDGEQGESAVHAVIY